MRPRIFGIGLAKTATTSLCDALTVLGFRSLHYPTIMQIDEGQLKFDWPWYLNSYDAMADVPAAFFFRELDAQFPNSKFILTTRDRTKWLASCRKHFTLEKFEAATKVPKYAEAILLNLALYGCSSFDLEKFEATYDKHEAEVRQYFQGKDNFLVMDICSGEGWEKLCSFLERPVPDVEFPMSNVRK
ncbi:MAG: sulfotransferase family protein [Cyanobacteria bacterium P01_F01_bin.4]